MFARPCPEPRADGNPPTFLPHRLHLGEAGPWQYLPQKKKEKNKRVPAKSYLVSFPVLASDAKSTGILLQGGEESDVAMADTGHLAEGGGTPGIPERVTD